MNKIIRNLGIVAALCLLFACSNITEPINSKATIIGVITKINTHSDQLRILVEEDPTVTGPDHKNGKKLLLFISNKTKIYQQVNSELTKIKGNDLTVGMNVEVWAGKLFLESYPAQTDAVKIIVLGK